MIEYKQRKIDYEQPVQIYRCLNRKGKTYSIKQFGKVVAHTNGLFVLKDCSFIINSSGKKRAIQTNTRNVHAYIQGYLTNQNNIKNSFSYILKYYPFETTGFFYNIGENKIVVNTADVIYNSGEHIMIQPN